MTIKRKKGWDVVALFLITLVLTLPIYSAQALAASVQITKNTGKAGLPNFLDAKEDTWTVQATITNLGEIAGSLTPEQMEITVEGTKGKFETCSETTGGYLCEYLSDLSSGVGEGVYNVQVKHLPSGASDGDTISADGSAPKIEITRFKQAGNDLLLDFTVKDKPDAGVGLARIDIIDADSGSVLQSIASFRAGQREFNYATAPEYNGKLAMPSFLTGEGQKRIKIYAEDKLAHGTTSSVKSTFADFVAPEVIDGSLRFLDLGEFIGTHRITSRMQVNITESSDMRNEGVTATSDQLHFVPDNKATCVEDSHHENLWTCTWNNVEVEPAANIAVTISATDEFGNVKEKILSKVFTQDTSAPAVESFRTRQQYQEKSYVKNGENVLSLRVTESGAGIEKEGIRANLGALGGGIDVEPQECTHEEQVLACSWTLPSVAGLGGFDAVRVSLTKLQDMVGNEGDLPTEEFLVDTAPPVINPRGFEAQSISPDGRKTDFFKSGDKIQFRLNVSEPRSGVLFKVDLNDVVNDAQTFYPASENNEAGWEVFREDQCLLLHDEEKNFWDCTFETSQPLRSGYLSSASIAFEMEDSAGNKVQSWPQENKERMRRSSSEREERARYSFEKLGVVDESNPDYWEVANAGVQPQIPFIDLDTTELTNTRMSFAVTLTAKDARTRVREILLTGCDGKSPGLGRQVLWNNVYADPRSAPATFNLLIEFPPFNGKEYFAEELKAHEESGQTFTTAEVLLTCTLRIYSQVGNDVVQAAETQTVDVAVLFGFTELGSADENLKQTIEKEKEGVRTGFWGFIGAMNDVLRVVKYIAQVGQLIASALLVWFTGEEVFGAAESAVETIPVAGNAALADRLAYCAGSSIGQAGLAKTGLDWLQVPLQVLSCQKISPSLDSKGVPDTSALSRFAGWYGTYVSDILGLYNGLVNDFEEPAQKNILAALDFSKDRGTSKAKKDAAIPFAGSVYDNLYLSVLSLCIPGIIHNLNKYRQIECRYISCLEQDVATGKATVAACGELRDVLVCKYFIGPLWELIPLAAVIENFLKAIETALSSPVAVVRNGIILGCMIDCLTPTAGVPTLAISGGCKIVYFGDKVLSLIESVVGTFQSIAAELNQGGLDYCDQVLDEEEDKEAPPEELTGQEASTPPAETPP